MRHLDELKALIVKLAPGRDVHLYVRAAWDLRGHVVLGHAFGQLLEMRGLWQLLRRLPTNRDVGPPGPGDLPCALDRRGPAQGDLADPRSVAAGPLEEIQQLPIRACSDQAIARSRGLRCDMARVKSAVWSAVPA